MLLRCIFSIVTLSCLVDDALGGRLVVTDPTRVGVGQDAKLLWTLKRDSGDPPLADIVSIRCGSDLSSYTSGQAPLLAIGDAQKFSVARAAELFGGRLLASMSTGKYLITIINVNYTDARRYGCSYLFSVDAAVGQWDTAHVSLIVQDSPVTEQVSRKNNTPAVVGGVVAALIVLVIVIVVIIIFCRKKNAGKERARSDHQPLHQIRTNEDGARKSETHYAKPDDVLPPTKNQNGASQQPGLQYGELGPGGRVGPRGQPSKPHYAEVKQDERGFPAVGNPNEPVAKSLPRGQTAPQGDRSAAGREPRYFAKDRGSDQDEESDGDHEGVIV